MQTPGKPEDITVLIAEETPSLMDRIPADLEGFPVEVKAARERGVDR